MKHLLPLSAVTLSLATLAAADAPPRPLPPPTMENLSDEHVVQGMQRAIDYLLAQAARNQNVWEHEKVQTDFHKWPQYAGGVTALATYALLHAGDSLPDDRRLRPRSPELKPALEALAKFNSDMNYVRAYQTAALAQLPNSPENRALLKRVSDPMFLGIAPTGGHTYRLGRAQEVMQGKWDTSNTQIVLLAAWERANAGLELPLAYWQAQEKFWRVTQKPDGSWHYKGEKGSHRDSPHAMTAAALASLFILQEQLPGPVVLASKPDKAMDGGLAWMDKNFTRDLPMRGGTESYYYLYCLERMGLAAGRKTINNIDWYRAGAVELLKRQQKDGSWEPVDKWFDGDSRCVATSLSLIFLARGRNPVAFNKLEYDGNTWNARPRDAANLTHWMQRQFERAINWQVVSTRDNAALYMDAPVLLITGSADPNFTDDHLARLRAYVEGGGIIFSTADGDNAAFTKAMQTCAGKITGNQYEMRELPADHPVFHAWGKVKSPPRMLALSNGAREVWIHSPTDFSALWQRRAYASADQWTVSANIFFYAAGATESLAPKLRSLSVEVPKAEPKVKTSLARLEYPGNFDPEPGAFRRLVRILRRDASAEVAVTTVKVENLDFAKTRIAHLAGTAAFTISDDGIKKLRAFLDAGGTLLIDNTGGGDHFQKSVDTLARALYPDDLLAPVPAGDPLFAGDFPGGAKITETTYRKAAVLKRGPSRTPEVLGIRKGPRYTILSTPIDTTSGLLGTNTAGIVGYTPDSAVAIMRNLVLYAATPPKPAPANGTQPAK